VVVASGSIHPGGGMNTHLSNCTAFGVWTVTESERENNRTPAGHVTKGWGLFFMMILCAESSYHGVINYVLGL